MQATYPLEVKKKSLLNVPTSWHDHKQLSVHFFFYLIKNTTYLFQVLYKNDWLDMELYHSQQQRKLIQNHIVLQQVLIHSPATKKKENKMINNKKFTSK